MAMIARDLKVGERFRISRSLLRMMIEEVAPPNPYAENVIVEYVGVNENGDGTVDVVMRSVPAVDARAEGTDLKGVM